MGVRQLIGVNGLKAAKKKAGRKRKSNFTPKSEDK